MEVVGVGVGKRGCAMLLVVMAEALRPPRVAAMRRVENIVVPLGRWFMLLCKALVKIRMCLC